MTYVPLTYVQDVVAMLDELAIARFAAIGTSLGGLVAMLMAATLPGRLVGAVLNDVGPELETAGLERIRDYIGAGGSQPTRSEEHTSELQSLMRISYAVFCLKKKTTQKRDTY